MIPVEWDAVIDIGGNRGRLAPGPAASLRRVDAQLGHMLQITEAWRSPEQADANAAAYAAYRRYLNGGPWAPWAPIGLDRWHSLHCQGEAIDTDEGSRGNPAADVLYDNGWRAEVATEVWHWEYHPELDNHIGELAGSSSGGIITPGTTRPKEIDMLAFEAKDLLPGWNFLIAPGFVKNAPEQQADHHAQSVGAWVNRYDNQWLTECLWNHGFGKFFHDTDSLKTFLMSLTGGGYIRTSEFGGDDKIH